MECPPLGSFLGTKCVVFPVTHTDLLFSLLGFLSIFHFYGLFILTVDSWDFLKSFSYWLHLNVEGYTLKHYIPGEKLEFAHSVIFLLKQVVRKYIYLFI